MGRALVHVLLKRAGATQRLTMPISAGLLVDTTAYFEALTDFRGGNAVPIVQHFTEAFWRTWEKAGETGFGS